MMAQGRWFFRQKQWIMSNNDHDDENYAKPQKEGTHG
jgi:hypothetical protein